MATLPFSLKGDGDGMATPPISLKENDVYIYYFEGVGANYRQSLIRARVYMGLQRAVWFNSATRANHPERAGTHRCACHLRLVNRRSEKKCDFFCFFLLFLNALQS